MNEFEALYAKYYKDVYYFLLKLTGYQDGLTEELTQESFYQAFTSFERFRGECTVKSWLCQIAKNTYYKHIRTHVKQEALEQRLSYDSKEKPISDLVEEKLVTAQIMYVIDTLDERERMIAQYRLLHEMSYKEIGERLGIREATAKVLFSRTKVKIKNKIKEEYGYEI